LIDLGIYGDSLEEIIVDLIEDNFLNEERFACSYARGKFRMRDWGRIRILQELKLRKISDYCIKKAMQEISDEDYQATIDKLIEKKWKEVKESNLFKKRGKIGKYLMGKGYESKWIWPALKKFK